MQERAFTTIWPRVRGLRICTRVSTSEPADGRTVVLVHGLGVSATYMVPTLERLAPHFTVLAPELPGFGQSDKPTEVLDLPELADYLAAWMDTFGLASALFVGNSMGCQVIIDLAARHPARVIGAVLVGPTTDKNGRSMPRQLWRGMRDLVHEPWSLFPILARDYLQSGTRQIFKTLRFALQDRVEEKCALVQAPMLLVRGEFDAIAPGRWLDELSATNPKISATSIKAAAHAANYSAPDELVTLVRGFV